jgi:hypothetical protein
MPQDYARIWPLLFAALAVFLIYRRFRRTFGRQPVRPLRMTLRMAILTALGLALLPLALKSQELLLVETLCAAAGIALALWGAKRTRYLKIGEQLYYVPHTYTGIAVSLLVVGRIVYRIVQVYSAAHAQGPGMAGASAPAFGPGSMLQNPITVGLFFVLIGYYVCYYSRILWKSKHISAADLEAPSVAAAP